MTEEEEGRRWEGGGGDEGGGGEDRRWWWGGRRRWWWGGVAHDTLCFGLQTEPKREASGETDFAPLRFHSPHRLFINSGCSGSIWAEPPTLYFLPLLVQCMHNRYTVKPHSWIHVLGLIKHCVTETVSANTDCSEYIQQHWLHLKMLQKCLNQQESLNS